MGRPITLVTGQWTDLSLETLSQKAAKWGYDGLELACWGGHFDVGQGASSKAYCEQHKALLGQYGLKVWAISNHLAGQMVWIPMITARTTGHQRNSGASQKRSLHGQPKR